MDALTQACKTHRLAFERLISRAYHDSLFMSRIAPTAMLFIPCRGGVSHRPDEYASPEAIAQGDVGAGRNASATRLLSFAANVNKPNHQEYCE